MARAAGVTPAAARPPRAIATLVGATLRAAPVVALIVLLVGAISPYGPATALEFDAPDAYRSFWNTRIGPANLFELGVLVTLVLATPWLLLADVGRRPLDGAVLAGAAVLLVAELAALALGDGTTRAIAFGVEFPVTAVAGYAMASRALVSPRAATVALWVLAGALLVRFFDIAIRVGILEGTQFGTATGREALVITEDSLLVIIPIVLLWGRIVDGRTRKLIALAGVAVIVAAIAVDVYSLRRGALVMIGLALAVRSLSLPRRKLAALAAGVVLLGAAVSFAGPAEPLRAQARYAVESVLGANQDTSIAARQSEYGAWAANTSGAQWVIGHGLGAYWRDPDARLDDRGTFGSGETVYQRLGWHSLGLDWAYVVGIGGVLALAALGALVLAGAARRAAAFAGERRNAAWCLVLVLPPLWLLALTNLRIALLAGVCLGLLSVIVDDRQRAG